MMLASTLTQFIVAACIILLILLLFPFALYLSVKLGTYAFYRGRYLFNRHHFSGENHGDETSTDETK